MRRGATPALNHRTTRSWQPSLRDGRVCGAHRGLKAPATGNASLRDEEQVNLLHGYRTLRIVNPLELIYGNEDEVL